VRDAVPEDAAGCAALYAPYVRDTAVSFEVEPPTPEEVAERISAAQERHAWLVLADGPDLVGYAYAGPWRARPAYRWTCEVSVYVDQAHRGTGAGGVLYGALLLRLTDLGYRTVVAGMTEPNPASRALHLSAGFVHVGTLPSVGWKLGRWHDVSLWVRHLPPGSAGGRPGKGTS
jgi:phosphinothricin acetyltransferase